MTIRLSILTAFTTRAIIIILLINLNMSPANALFTEPQPQDPNEDVFFGIVPKAFGSPYRMSGIAPDGIASVFFQSEPVILELVLKNYTKRAIPIAGTKGRWTNMIEWQILKDGTKFDLRKVKMVDRSTEIKLNSFGRPVNSNSVGILTIGGGESAKKEISLVLADGSAIPAGKYKVNLLLSPNSLGSQFPQPDRTIPAQADFIVKKIEGLGDRLNYYSHLVQRYWLNKEYDKAHLTIKQMLDVNPNSLFAYVILGEIFCEKGNPQQAAESIKKAMNILENNSDKNHRYFDQEHLREQNIASLKERLINIPSRCGKKP